MGMKMDPRKEFIMTPHFMLTEVLPVGTMPKIKPFMIDIKDIQGAFPLKFLE